MNISCSICSDLFIPSDEVYITQCGHIFHFSCLIHWIERSKTCPQCRFKSTEKTIHRVYFNLANTDGITDDVGTLMHKLENVQLQLRLKEKDVKLIDEKYQKIKRQSDMLRGEVIELEDKIRAKESSIHAIKEQMSYFKSKAKESNRHMEEVAQLKNSLKELENVKVAVEGTREEVNEMLRNEHRIDSLALLAATLKKSLVDADRRKRDMEFNLKKAQNDVTRYKREVTTLECQNNDLRKEIQHVKDSSEKEKQYLKSKILDLNKKISASNLDITNTSLKRIVTESPVNFNRKPQVASPEDVLNKTASPSVDDKVQRILDSDSPYLPVKSSNVGINYNSILNTKTKFITPHGYSIFKPKTTKTLDTIKLVPRPNSEVTYNGLGGSSKEDIFPSPKPIQTGLKRHKSNSSISSSKYRKLAPAPAKSRVTNYFSESSHQ